MPGDIRGVGAAMDGAAGPGTGGPAAVQADAVEGGGGVGGGSGPGRAGELLAGLLGVSRGGGEQPSLDRRRQPGPLIQVYIHL